MERELREKGDENGVGYEVLYKEQHKRHFSLTL
jgi:hypothetical protein